MELGPAQREYVRLIRQSGDHLLELINGILDFSRLEAQRVELEEVALDPRALIQGVADMFLIQAGGKGLHLSAIVSVTHEPETDGQVRLRFSVADSGIGIAPDAIGRMFQEFTQMDGSISRRFGGSGLGLAISRRLVELMGGSLTVESEPNNGSTFSFDVALKLAQAVAPALVTVDELQATEPLNILLAEDNATNRIVAERLLDRLGHRVATVGNGIEVIAALKRTRYDLILMDVMMPEMDGLAATRRIRMNETGATRIPIVGLTAAVGADRLAACLEAGMDAVATKPITLSRLRGAIMEGCKTAETHVRTLDEGASTPRLRELADVLGEEAVAEIVRTFAEDTQANLAGLREAALRDDRRTIGRIAHSVAGAGRNVGADALASRASGLEEAVGTLRVAQILAEIAAMQDELQGAFGRLGIEPCVDT
jgi:CheY-like chemotaxis protein